MASDITRAQDYNRYAKNVENQPWGIQQHNLNGAATSTWMHDEEQPWEQMK